MDSEQAREFASQFLDAVVRQDADALMGFFAEDASVYWHNSGEVFTATEYVRVNCEYPGDWSGSLERIELSDDALIAVSKVTSGGESFRAVSFFRLSGACKIERLDEYWGDVGEPPEWRR